MYDDDEIEEMLEEEMALEFEEMIETGELTEASVLELDPSEYGLYSVTCKCGCGTFALEEMEVLTTDVLQSTATFRCKLCNDIQTAELLILD